MPVLFESGIRLISIHIHVHIVTKPQVYVLRQGYRRHYFLKFSTISFNTYTVLRNQRFGVPEEWAYHGLAQQESYKQTSGRTQKHKQETLHFLPFGQT
jgi:hypothetical protein